MNRRVAMALIGLLLGYVVLGSVYAYVTPPFEKPDENWHFAYAMYLATTGKLPLQKLEAPEHLARQEADQAPLYYGLLAAVIRFLGPERVSRGYEALAEHNPYYGYSGPLAPDNGNAFVHGRCEGDCRWTARALYAGRALSLLLGLGALVAAAVTIRLVFPAEPALLLAVVAAMAFNPQFLHVASAVSNDVLTAGLTAACFAALAAWLHQPDNVRRVWLLGLLGGLTALSKVNALTAVGTTGLVLLLASPLPWRRRLQRCALWAIIVLGICGWWYGRNWVLYGDPTAIRMHMAISGGHPIALTWSRFIEEWRGISDSFWASFLAGAGIMFPWAAAYIWARLAAIVLSVSFLIAAIRHWRELGRQPAPPGRRPGVRSAAGWCVARKVYEDGQRSRRAVAFPGDAAHRHHSDVGHVGERTDAMAHAGGGHWVTGVGGSSDPGRGASDRPCISRASASPGQRTRRGAGRVWPGQPSSCAMWPGTKRRACTTCSSCGR